jgi:hypothetical protein
VQKKQTNSSNLIFIDITRLALNMDFSWINSKAKLRLGIAKREFPDWPSVGEGKWSFTSPHEG